MTLTQEQINNLSKNLSKISLKEDKMTEDINGILQYINLLNEVDTTWVEPTVSVVEKKSSLRKDEISQKIPTKELLNCSNQKIISDQIAISNIMK